MSITIWLNVKFSLPCACILLFISSFGVKAQKYDSAKFSYVNFYFNTQVAIPSREFRDVIKNDFGNLGYGIATGVVLSPLLENKASPVLLGLDFGYFTYGKEKQIASSTSPALKTTHNVFTWNGIGRLRPRFERGAITPFVDGLLGLKLYNTKTKIDKNIIDFIFNDDQREVINNVKDTGVNFGLGAGFYVNQKVNGGPGFMIRCLYLWGDEVNYVVRNSLKVDSNGFVTYETARANTTMFIIQLGINASALKTLVTSPD
jgi:hypothetical protein